PRDAPLGFDDVWNRSLSFHRRPVAANLETRIYRQSAAVVAEEGGHSPVGLALARLPSDQGANELLQQVKHFVGVLGLQLAD
ncbi:MAG TPA: hypothetical protein VLV31_06915, partial [Candidatus Acidoferrales bacterium]|nr:hypothetical protein [Candidatus Acidoferrales bacterium]